MMHKYLAKTAALIYASFVFLLKGMSKSDVKFITIYKIKYNFMKK